MSPLYENAVPHPLGHREVTPDQVLARLGDARVVDVREPHEFTGDLGHIDGAELVPLATIGAASAGWAKDADIVVVCRSGRRSERASAQLALAGFGRVMNMVGGMLAWNEAGLPVAGAP